MPCGFDTAALPPLQVGALSAQASERFLDLHHPSLAAGLRRLILDEAQGNPLALRKLPPHLLDAPAALLGNQSPASPDLPGYPGIPVPRRLQQVYDRRALVRPRTGDGCLRSRRTPLTLRDERATGFGASAVAVQEPFTMLMTSLSVLTRTPLA